jgi:UDP-glucose 4-epimerase
VAILVTGGAGYIGSHTCVKLVQAGYDVIVIDNLSNSKAESLKRVCKLTGAPIIFYQADLLDVATLERIIGNHVIDAVIHFAGLKAVGESNLMPLRYYQNNLVGTLNLCGTMQKNAIKNLVFSSSATVYGDSCLVPIKEDSPLRATNPYGRSKLMIEELLFDLSRADSNLNMAILRYFNPVGAHPSGLIGEDPHGIPNNLLPYIAKVAAGKIKELNIFGHDYSTPDGTGIRDYIHVMDLAQGHLKALEKLQTNPGVVTYNLGTGMGYSVLEMVAAFKKASGKNIPYRFVERRAGDIGICYADPSKASKDLGWKAKRGIEEMCADAWRWQSKNPNGYKEFSLSWQPKQATAING